MFKFLKKLFGCKVNDQITDAVTAECPYKIESPTVQTSSFKDVEVAPKAVKLRQPGQPKQGAKKPAQGKKPAGNKPQGPKVEGQTKPAQPKQSGGKPRSRKPKAKPVAPQQ